MSSQPRKDLTNDLTTGEMDNSLGLNTAHYISHIDNMISVVLESSDVRLSMSTVDEPGKLEQLPSHCAELHEKLEAVLKEKDVLERKLSEAVICNQVILTT